MNRIIIRAFLVDLLVLLQLLVCVESDDSRASLHVLSTAPACSDFSAVQFAIDQINQDNELLQDYKLVAVEGYSSCEGMSNDSVVFFENVLYGDEKIIGLIGPACSSPALTLAPLLARNELSLIQISPAATSPRFQENDFNTTFTMISPSNRLVDTLIALMYENNWRRLATLYDIDRDTFTPIHFYLREEFEKQPGFEIVYTSHVVNSFYPLDGIIEARSKIILLLTKTSSTMKILCLAYHMNMVFPNYQWVLTADTRIEIGADVEEFTYRDEVYECSSEMITTVLNGTVLIANKISVDDEEFNSTNGLAFIQQKQSYLMNNRLLSAYQDRDNKYYDSTWAFAYALHSASKNGLNLTEYGTGQSNLTSLLAQALSEVNFNGVSGHIKFTKNRNVDSLIVVYQLWTDRSNGSIAETVIAQYNGTLQLIENNSAIFIPDSFMKSPQTVHIALGIAMSLIAIGFSIFAFSLQSMIVLYGHRRSIKATSPNLSHLIFSGCHLFALATVLYSLQQSVVLGFITDKQLSALVYSVICNVITWCLQVGYTLIFGTVCIKVWRVYRLFHHFKNEKLTCLNNDVLIGMVIVLIVLDCVFCVLWGTIDPWLQIEANQHYEADRIIISLSCSCEYMFYWIGVCAGYKGSIAVLLVIFSILNRKIRKEHFKHTKKINILVYSLTVIYGTGFPIYFLLTGTNIIYIPYLTLCVILLSTVLICSLTIYVSPAKNGKQQHTKDFCTTTYY